MGVSALCVDQGTLSPLDRGKVNFWGEKKGLLSKFLLPKASGRKVLEENLT